ncbi:MAG: GNAT family N-acetyltransferase, partial [Actinomycetes bacterium]
MDVRMASVDDLDAVVDLAGIVDPPSDGVDVDRDYYSNILEHGRLSVADASGIVIGYCGAIPVGGTRHLSDLFVHPDAHARGIGGQLLEAVWDAPASEVPRHTFSSVHPSALPLYVLAGMRPLWPLLY